MRSRLFGAVVLCAAPLAGDPAAAQELRGEAAQKFLDSLIIPDSRKPQGRQDLVRSAPVPAGGKTGAAAIEEVVGATVPMRTDTGFDIYRFRSVLASVNRGAPHFDRLQGGQKTDPKTGRTCFDFGKGQLKFCARASFADGVLKLERDDGTALSGTAYYDKDKARPGQATDFPPGTAVEVNFVQDCSTFQQFGRAAAQKRSFRSLVLTTDHRKADTFDDGEPYFEAQVETTSTANRCFVNEGTVTAFCQVGNLVGRAAEVEAQYEQFMIRKIGRCFRTPAPVTVAGADRPTKRFTVSDRLVIELVRFERVPMANTYQTTFSAVFRIPGSKR